MGQRQTETFYQSEPAYLKSVLLWLQEYWTGPAPRFNPYKQVAQAVRHHSAPRTNAALDKENAIVDLPSFLPAGSPSEWRRRRPANQSRKLSARQ